MNAQNDLPSVLARTHLFDSLDREALEFSASICSHHHYEVQQRLFDEGDLGDEMFIVRSGRFSFRANGADSGNLALQIVEDQLLNMNQKIYAAFDQDFAAFQQDDRVLCLERYGPIGRQLMEVEAKWQMLVSK